MPLHIADYLRDTRRLTAAQHGAYLLLIMEYWVVGNLPNDDAALARIACMLPAEWKRERSTIVSFFTKDWKHKRIDLELAKVTDISSKRRAAAEQRHNKGNANGYANAEHEDDKSTHTRVVLSSSLPSFSATSLELEESQKEQACGKNGAEFVEFWREYPNKIGKRDARKKFDEALKTVVFEKLMDGLRLYKNKADDRPWCNPATWLHQGRWDDQPAQQQPRGGVLGALDKIERDIENGSDREAGEDAPLGLPPR